MKTPLSAHKTGRHTPKHFYMSPRVKIHTHTHAQAGKPSTNTDKKISLWLRREAAVSAVCVYVANTLLQREKIIHMDIHTLIQQNTLLRTVSPQSRISAHVVMSPVPYLQLHKHSHTCMHACSLTGTHACATPTYTHTVKVYRHPR